MNQCKHLPNVPFFVLFKKDQIYRDGGHIQFKCRKCGQMIEPNHQIGTQKLIFWISFSVVLVYSVFLRELLMKLFHLIEGLPNIAANLLTVLLGSVLAVFIVNTLFFVFLHLLKWKESSAQEKN